MTDPAVAQMAEALVEANDQLLALYDLLAVTIDSLDEPAAVAAVLDRGRALLDADAVLVRTPGGDHHRGPDPAVDELQRACDSADTGSRSAAASVVVHTPDGTPIEVAALRTGRPLGTSGTKLLHAVATVLAGTVHTTAMHRIAVERAIVANEHALASDLARSALPTVTPELPGVTVHARSDPARSAGGDLFHHGVIDGVLCFAVGDVSGKGLPSALIMARMMAALTAAFEQRAGDGPAAVLRLVDRWMHGYLSEAAHFITLLVGTYTPGTGRLCLANAGHSPVVLLRPDGTRSFPASVPPVGVVPLTDVAAAEVNVVDGDLLVVGSDGLTDQVDAGGEIFGRRRLLSLLADGAHDPAALTTSVYDALDHFADGTEPTDDRTLALYAFGEAP